MRKTHQKIAFADVPLDYTELVAMFPPRPIHDSADYANTLEIVMAMAGHALTRDQDLNGKRGLSKANILKLAEHFKVRADYFL